MKLQHKLFRSIVGRLIKTFFEFLLDCEQWMVNPHWAAASGGDLNLASAWATAALLLLGGVLLRLLARTCKWTGPPSFDNVFFNIRKQCLMLASSEHTFKRHQRCHTHYAIDHWQWDLPFTKHSACRNLASLGGHSGHFMTSWCYLGANLISSWWSAGQSTGHPAFFRCFLFTSRCRGACMEGQRWYQIHQQMFGSGNIREYEKTRSFASFCPE